MLQRLECRVWAFVLMVICAFAPSVSADPNHFLRAVARAAPDKRKPLLDKALIGAGKLKAAAEKERRRLATGAAQ